MRTDFPSTTNLGRVWEKPIEYASGSLVPHIWGDPVTRITFRDYNHPVSRNSSWFIKS